MDPYCSDADGACSSDDGASSSEEGGRSSDDGACSDCSYGEKTVVMDYINDDNRPEFVKEFRRWMRMREPVIGLSDIINHICRVGAVECASALLKGETGMLVDINARLYHGASPLHEAAASCNPALVNLFLRQGARNHVRSLERGPRFNLTPLDYALQKLSYHLYLVDWTPKESIYKLIISLCLPLMKETLETVRLLTSSDVCYVYAKEGKLVEMAALLMVAKKHIMASTRIPTSKDSYYETTTIYDNINKDIASLVHERIKLSIEYGERSKLVQMCKRKMMTLAAAYRLLLVFEKAGDAIESYRRSQPSNEWVAIYVAAVLREKGFILKDEDIDLSSIKCKSYDAIKGIKDLESSSSLESWFALQPQLLPYKYHEEKETTSLPRQFLWNPRSLSPIMQIIPKVCRPSWLSGALCTNLSTCGSVRRLSSSASCEPLKAQFKRETNAIQRPCVLPSKSSSLLALSFKRKGWLKTWQPFLWKMDLS